MKYSPPNTFQSSLKATQGFTLVELVTVIVLLGILSVSVGGFIKLSSQIYVDVTNRDELIASARFSVERINREIRSALPNSVRTISNTGNTVQCLEYIPSVTSTVYLDIPVSPEPANNTIELIRFNDSLINVASMSVAVYPLSANELYDGTSGRIFALQAVQTPIKNGNKWTYFLSAASQFVDDSPTQRLFFVDNSVSYCAKNGQLTRHAGGYSYSDGIPNNTGVLMAEYLQMNGSTDFPFRVSEATLLRNSLVSIQLKFSQNNEDVIFNNEVQVPNVP